MAPVGSDYFAPTYARMLVFKVGGNVEAAAAPRPTRRRTLNPPPSTATAEIIAQGGQVYEQQLRGVPWRRTPCSSASSFPNLTYTPFLHSQAGLRPGGAEGREASEKGMGDFSDRLNANESLRCGNTSSRVPTS